MSDNKDISLSALTGKTGEPVGPFDPRDEATRNYFGHPSQQPKHVGGLSIDTTGRSNGNPSHITESIDPNTGNMVRVTGDTNAPEAYNIGVRRSRPLRDPKTGKIINMNNTEGGRREISGAEIPHKKVEKLTPDAVTRSFAALDNAVKRKTKEAQEELNRMMAKSEELQDAVDNGLEQVQDEVLWSKDENGEFIHTAKPEELHRSSNNDNTNTTESSSNEELDDVEKDLMMDDKNAGIETSTENTTNDTGVKTKVTFRNPLSEEYVKMAEDGYFDDIPEDITDPTVKAPTEEEAKAVFNMDNNNEGEDVAKDGTGSLGRGNVEEGSEEESTEEEDDGIPTESMLEPAVQETSEEPEAEVAPQVSATTRENGSKEESTAVKEDDVDTPTDEDIKGLQNQVDESMKLLNSNALKVNVNVDKLPTLDADQLKSDSFDLDKEDFADLDPEDQPLSDDEEEARTKKQTDAGYLNLRNDILKKIINVSKNVDKVPLKISKKVVTVQSVMRAAEERNKNKAAKIGVFPLMHAGRPFAMTAMSGPEILLLQSRADNSNNFIANAQQMELLYKHDANPYKPSTYEAWAKTIPYADIQYVFASCFVANFEGANYLPYECDHCHHMYLSDNISIKDMLDFPNDTAKKRYNEIMAMPQTSSDAIEVETMVVPINDYFAIGFKVPSIYTVLNEVRGLNQDFRSKYEAIITTIMYIDTIYSIDPETGDMNPIGYRTYPGDVVKTFKSKIASYSKILNGFTSAEYSIISAYIARMNDTENNVSFKIPESECPKCHSKIDERLMTTVEMVFMRQLLVDLATTPREL